MAALIYLAGDDLNVPVPGGPTLMLDASPAYWFLYRYFEAANLDRRDELIDLYGGRVIDGYQLHRLRSELEAAKSDVEQQPDTWKVLVGWTGEPVSVDNEDWQTVTRDAVAAVNDALLDMIAYAEKHGFRFVTSGD